MEAKETKQIRSKQGKQCAYKVIFANGHFMLLEQQEPCT